MTVGIFVVAVVACLASSGCLTSAAEPQLPRHAEEVPAETGIVCSSGDTPTAVRRVVVRGATERSPCAVIRSIAGRPESARIVESDIEALFASGAYEDVVVVREHDERGSHLVFELRERPRIGSVALDGLASEAARAALTGFQLDAPDRVDPAWLRRSEQRLTETLGYSGFARATVQAAVQRPNDSHDTAVRFVIDEGPQTLLRRVSISGLRVANEKALRAALSLRPGTPAPPSLIERDELVVGVALLDFGLLSAKVDKRVVSSDDGTELEVSFQVREGPVYRLRTIAVSGELALDAKEIAPLLRRLKSGAVFSRTTVQDIETKLEELHAAASTTTRVNVEPKLELIDGTTEVNLTFEVAAR